jgi:hypothetical protein
MKNRSFIITGTALCVLAVFSWRLQPVQAQSLSNSSTNTTAASSAGVDSDGDGFTDAQEIAWGTDPHDPNSHPDLVTGMVAWLPLDEGQGTQALDVSGQGHNGTLEGSSLPTWTNDGSGPSLAFAGTQGQVVVPNSSELTPTNKFTMMAWIKVNPGVQGAVLSKKTSDASQTGYSLSITGGRLSALLRVGGMDRPLYGHVPVADGQWHHVACAYNGLEFRLFVDGVRDVLTHTGGAVVQTDGSLIIGQLAGQMRDVGLYQRAFNDGEIKLLYETTSTMSTQLARRQPAAPTFLYARLKERGRIQAAQAELGKRVTP